MRRATWRYGLAVLGMLVAVPSDSRSQGRILYVNAADGTCQGRAPCYWTIQTAVTAAQPGDRVVIQAGTYVEQVSVIGKNDTSAAIEMDRIVIEADRAAAPGTVVLRGAVRQCPDGFAVRFRQSKFVTLRGLTITGAGGPAVTLMGGNSANQAIHLERLRIFGNGSSECDGGIAVHRGNPDTVIVNSLIYGNGRNGLDFLDTVGGPHYVIGNTIHGHAWNGVSVARSHLIYLVNNAISGNGTASGSTGGRFGVRREPSAISQPGDIVLLHNLVCGNRLAEIEGPSLDSSDAGNLTPTGAEGPGVTAGPGCQTTDAVYADVSGADGLANTADDDFTPAAGALLIDQGLDPRTLALGLDDVFEADFGGDGARPRDATGLATARFDIGAIEVRLPNRPPAPDAGPDRTVVERTAVTLDGTASADPDDDPLTFAWTQTSGPVVTLTGAATASPTFTAPAVTTATALVFQLTVSDGQASTSASVTITVVPANHPPVLDPIGNKTVQVGATLTFAVSGSDPDGDPLMFSAAPLPANATFDQATRAFTFTPDASQAGAVSLTFEVSDGRGGTASETITITVEAALRVTITVPSAGSTVPAGTLVVRGLVEAAEADVGLVVNGLAAAVQGSVFAALVPVSADTNALTATATTAVTTASHSVPITVAGESTSTLVATPQSGAAPLIVRFSLPGAVPDTVSLDFDGNGTIDFAGAGLDTRTFLYAAPGVYVPTATAVGPNGQPASVSTVVQVSDPAALDGVLIAKWRAMRDALRVGDIAEAVTRIVADARDDYRAAFQAIAPRLPAIDTILTDIALVEIGDGSALYEAVRTDDGLVKVFDVRFAIDDDGVWRVEGF